MLKTFIFKKRSIDVAVALLFLLQTPLSFSAFKQIEASSFDFDDNIFVTDAQILVWDTANKTETAVSTADWALVKKKIGKENEWKNFTVQPDGLRFFGDTSPDGADLFKKQVLEALDKKKDGKWKGPRWQAFVQALANPQLRTRTSIITARLHSPDSVMKGLQLLKDRKLISALPDKKNIFAVGWPGLAEAFKGKSPAESKSKVMMSLLDEIESKPVPADATPVMNQDGTEKAPLHLWEFSDDDFDNYSKAYEALSVEVAKGRWSHIKLTLIFTGLNNPDEKPRATVIKKDGKLRPSLPSDGK